MLACSLISLGFMALRGTHRHILNSSPLLTPVEKD
jgi:hypothetical protein